MAELRTVFDFMLEHGRLPKIGEPDPPWSFMGWLLPYVQAGHASGLCANRWEHWLSAMEHPSPPPAGPIPQLRFDYGAPEARSNSKLVDKWLRPLERRGPWSSLGLLVDFMAYGLGVDKELARLDADEAEALYRGINVGPWLQAPLDYLGEFIAEHKASGWNPNAFFPTPHNLVEMMVEMSMPEQLPAATVCDPCCGSGRMLLHASNRSYRLFGQDIDGTLVKVTKINGALFAPWLAFPLPESAWPERSVSTRIEPAQQGQLAITF